MATLVCFAGCAPTATIVRNDSPNNEAEILHSDERAIYVAGAEGQTYRIGRENVVDIDHPGNVELVVGGILLAFGGALVIGGVHDHDMGQRTAGAIYGAPGLLLLGTGLYRYITSKSAASAFENVEHPPPPLGPPRLPPPMMPAPYPPVVPPPAPQPPAAPAPATPEPPPPAPPAP
jgi:hypothetical protein